MSLRLATRTIERLGVRARRAQLPPRTLAQRYVAAWTDPGRVAYYGQHQAEIDEWIEINQQQAAEAHEAWHAGQAAMKQ